MKKKKNKTNTSLPENVAKTALYFNDTNAAMLVNNDFNQEKKKRETERPGIAKASAEICEILMLLLDALQIRIPEVIRSDQESWPRVLNIQ